MTSWNACKLPVPCAIEQHKLYNDNFYMSTILSQVATLTFAETAVVFVAHKS